MKTFHGGIAFCGSRKHGKLLLPRLLFHVLSITKMKLILTAFFFLLCNMHIQAQEEAYFVQWTNGKADSVKKQLRVTGNDTLKMKMARSLGLYYQEINRDSAFHYTMIQLALAKKMGQRFWEADAYEGGGWLLSQLKNYPLSLEYLLNGLKLAEDKSIEKNIWLQSFFSPGKDAAYTRLTTLGFVHNDLSQLYHQTGDTAKERQEIVQGIGIARQIGNDILLALLKSNLSQLYTQSGFYDSVIIYGLQSLSHMRQSGYLTYEGYQLNLIGSAYIEMGKLAKAKTYLDSSVLTNRQNGNIVKLPDAYFSYARIFEIEQKPDSAIACYKKAIAAFHAFNQPGKVAAAYLSLYHLYKENRQNDSAQHYLELYQPLNDSLNKIEKDQVQASQNFALNKQVEYQQNESLRITKANTNRTYAFLAGIAVLLLIAFLLYRNNRVRRKANNLLQQQKSEIEAQKTALENTLTELKSAQAQLIQSEKMASLGELTAGIAHEIQNPLNFVNNFSEINRELIDEIKSQKSTFKTGELDDLLEDIAANEEKIYHHGKRAEAIVKGMLQHSRKSDGQKELTDINALCDEYLRLSFHGIRAKDKAFHATLKTDFDPTIGKINIVPQEIGRVIMNLLNNAFYAVNAKTLSGFGTPTGLQATGKYEPTVTIKTVATTHSSGGRSVEILVSDNGNGIPASIKDKIFQPFFTTKPTGQGTGLGLSLSYDSIRSHGGDIKTEGKEGEGSTFIIRLPYNQ